MRKWLIGSPVVIALIGTLIWFNTDRHLRYLLLNPPADINVLFWTTQQRDAGFRSLDSLPVVPKNIIYTSSNVSPLPAGSPLALTDAELDSFMEELRVAGVIVLHRGKVRLERYGLGMDKDDKWTSFSVAKSFTSTLVGAAIKDGYIKSLDDKVTDYIPSMLGSAYDAVSIEQLLTMTSGIAWNEDYSDINSDVSKFNFHTPEPGVDAIASYMRQLPRAVEPGTRWLYSTGETNLIGLLVSQATGKTLSAYLTEKVWQNIGTEHDASWVLGPSGSEIGGCCVQSTVRDYLRFAQFVMHGAMVDGTSIVHADWFAKATTSQADIGSDTKGYGFQWWTNNDGSFEARGIFGQGLFIDPNNDLVIALNANWPKAGGEKYAKGREAFYRRVQSLVSQ